jgi:hypothetical protein
MLSFLCRVAVTHLLAATNDATSVVAAWGVHGTHRGRDEDVIERFRRAGARISCLDRTKAGHPRHPLYSKGNLRFGLLR